MSHASKVMLKIIQARLEQYVNHGLPDVQAGFIKGRGTRDQISNIRWITEKASEFQKNIYFCFIDYAKAFDCVDHNKLWKILKEKDMSLSKLRSWLWTGKPSVLQSMGLQRVGHEWTTELNWTLFFRNTGWEGDMESYYSLLIQFQISKIN